MVVGSKTEPKLQRKKERGTARGDLGNEADSQRCSQTGREQATHQVTYSLGSDAFWRNQPDATMQSLFQLETRHRTAVTSSLKINCVFKFAAVLVPSAGRWAGDEERFRVLWIWGLSDLDGLQYPLFSEMVCIHSGVDFLPLYICFG